MYTIYTKESSCDFEFYTSWYFWWGYLAMFISWYLWRKMPAEWLWQSNIQKYTFKMALEPCKQYFVMFSEGLKLPSRFDIYTTWGMARAGLSGSELGADLSAWLAKITARLSGSMAPSRAICITSSMSIQAQIKKVDEMCLMLLMNFQNLSENIQNKKSVVESG